MRLQFLKKFIVFNASVIFSLTIPKLLKTDETIAARYSVRHFRSSDGVFRSQTAKKQFWKCAIMQSHFCRNKTSLCLRRNDFRHRSICVSQDILKSLQSALTNHIKIRRNQSYGLHSYLRRYFYTGDAFFVKNSTFLLLFKELKA